jgi:hypothetical protein
VHDACSHETEQHPQSSVTSVVPETVVTSLWCVLGVCDSLHGLPAVCLGQYTPDVDKQHRTTLRCEFLGQESIAQLLKKSPSPLAQPSHNSVLKWPAIRPYPGRSIIQSSQREVTAWTVSIIIIIIIINIGTTALCGPWPSSEILATLLYSMPHSSSFWRPYCDVLPYRTVSIGTKNWYLFLNRI